VAHQVLSVLIWSDADAVTCSDDAPVDDLLHGRTARTEAHDGLWHMNQDCDLVQLRSGNGRTVVRGCCRGIPAWRGCVRCSPSRRRDRLRLCCGPSGSSRNWVVTREVGGSKLAGTKSCAVTSSPGAGLSWRSMAASVGCDVLRAGAPTSDTLGTCGRPTMEAKAFSDVTDRRLRLRQAQAQRHGRHVGAPQGVSKTWCYQVAITTTPSSRSECSATTA